QSKLFVPDFHVPKGQHAAMGVLRQALDGGRVLELDYADDQGRRTKRAVRPLGLFYWGRSWTLTAWCELRTDFRNFRLARIVAASALARAFAPEPGRRLEDFLELMERKRQDPKAAAREFQRLGSVGPACAQDLVLLGFRSIDELRGQDPVALYGRLCELT